MIMDALLTLPLPPTLRRLRLSASCPSIHAQRVTADYTESRLANRTHDLQIKYPSLSFISLDEMDVQLTWDGSGRQTPMMLH